MRKQTQSWSNPWFGRVLKLCKEKNLVLHLDLNLTSYCDNIIDVMLQRSGTIHLQYPLSSQVPNTYISKIDIVWQSHLKIRIYVGWKMFFNCVFWRLWSSPMSSLQAPRGLIATPSAVRGVHSVPLPRHNVGPSPPPSPGSMPKYPQVISSIMIIMHHHPFSHNQSIPIHQSILIHSSS